MKRIILIILCFVLLTACDVKDTGTKGEYVIENINGEKETINFPKEAFTHYATNSNEITFTHIVSFYDGIDVLGCGYVLFRNVTKDLKENGDVEISFNLITVKSLDVVYFDTPNGDILYEKLQRTVAGKECRQSFVLKKEQIDSINENGGQEITIMTLGTDSGACISFKLSELQK